MTPDKCPGCGTRLKPDMLACPNCPMSFPEDEGPTGVSNPFKQSRYYQFLLPVLFFGGIAWGVWALAVGFMRLGEENFKKAEDLNISKEKEIVKGSGLAAMHLDASTATPVSPAKGGSPTSEGEAPDALPEGGPIFIMSHVADEPGARPAHAPKPVREWKLRGAVYDLTTLKPVPGAALEFKDEERNKVVKTRTDSAGRYRTIVPSLGERGYLVVIKKGGYAANYLDPSIAGVPRLSAPKRLEMAQSLADTLTAAPATVEAPNAAPLVTDFYLAPRP